MHLSLGTKTPKFLASSFLNPILKKISSSPAIKNK
jgi:hypothetical protein